MAHSNIKDLGGHHVSKLLYCTSSLCVASRFPQQQRSCKVERFRVQDEASSVWYSEVYSYHKWAQANLTTLSTSKGGEEARRGIATGWRYTSMSVLLQRYCFSFLPELVAASGMPVCAMIAHF